MFRASVARYLTAAQALGVSRLAPELSEGHLSRLAAIGKCGPRQVEPPSEELLVPRADQSQRWLTGDRVQITRIQESLGQQDCRLTERMEDNTPGEVAEMDFGRLSLLHDPATSRSSMS